jgi:hypothetical protein
MRNLLSQVRIVKTILAGYSQEGFKKPHVNSFDPVFSWFSLYTIVSESQTTERKRRESDHSHRNRFASNPWMIALPASIDFPDDSPIEYRLASMAQGRLGVSSLRVSLQSNFVSEEVEIALNKFAGRDNGEFDR